MLFLVNNKCLSLGSRMAVAKRVLNKKKRKLHVRETTSFYRLLLFFFKDFRLDGGYRWG